MGNNKFIEYTERNDDLGIPQVVQGMAVRELSDLELVIISGFTTFGLYLDYLHSMNLNDQDYPLCFITIFYRK